jgi:hypothetical protein
LLGTKKLNGSGRTLFLVFVTLKDWGLGMLLGGSVLALYMRGPEFDPQYHKKENPKKSRGGTAL